MVYKFLRRENACKLLLLFSKHFFYLATSRIISFFGKVWAFFQWKRARKCSNKKGLLQVNIEMLEFNWEVLLVLLLLFHAFE